MTSRRGYLIIICFIILLSFVVYITNHQNATKVVYDFPCGVPKTLVNPMSKDSTTSQFVIDRSKMWTQKKLEIYFMDDHITQETIDDVVEIANEWSEYSNIKFVSTEDIGKSDIRISFSSRKGYVSEIGNDAEKEMGKSTMSLGDLNNEKNNIKLKSIVLHEFGHALGLLHEMNNPNNPIVWKIPETYIYFKEEYGLESFEVDEQVINDIIDVKYSVFDSLSIMTYPIPAKLTHNNISIPMVSELSEKDKINIGINYN